MEKSLENNDQEKIPLIPIEEYNTRHYWIKEPKAIQLNKANIEQKRKERINN